MNLFRYVFNRVLQLFPTLVGVSLLTFSLAYLVPGDPARLAAGPQASQEMYEQIREEFGYNDPIWQQFWGYLVNLVQGDWGNSVLTRRPVLDDLMTYWPATVELVVLAMTIATLIGMPLGVISAVKADKLADHAARIISLIGVSMPVFWMAILLQLLLGLNLGWLPIGGRLPTLMAPPESITGLYLVDSLLTGNWEVFFQALKNIALPAITLSFASLATVARFTRASMLDVLNNDYVRTARAKGLRERAVIIRHVMRNALIPTITMIGLSFGWSMGGSVLVETVFDWPGIGLYATKSAMTLDFMPIMGIALLYAIVFSIINIAVDIAYVFLDPRVAQP